MLRSDLERLDESKAVAGRGDLAYQSPELDQGAGAKVPAAPMDLPLPGHGSPEIPAPAVAPLEAVAWQNAIEQLLELLDQGRPNPVAPLPENLLPAALVGAPDGEVPQQPGQTDPGAALDYVIENLSAETPPVLSLDDEDLFGDNSEPTIDLMTTESSRPATVFQGMEGDLFGPGQGVAPISISKNDNSARIKPAEEPEPVPDNDGYISLLGEPLEIELTVEEARALANEHGELFVDGDGDDLVRLSGEWIYAGERSEKGAQYYTDASGTLELTLHNTKAVLV